MATLISIVLIIFSSFLEIIFAIVIIAGLHIFYKMIYRNHLKAGWLNTAPPPEAEAIVLKVEIEDEQVKLQMQGIFSLTLYNNLAMELLLTIRSVITIPG